MSQLKVKFKKLHADTKLPVKGSLDAACYDVYATSVEVDENRTATYKLGFATEIPKGYMGILIPRSNLTKHRWVMNHSTGIIDSDYRGEWMLKLSSIGDLFEPLPYSVGDRVGQIYFIPVLPTTFEEVEELESSERGEGGFGSSGISNLTTNIADGKINING